MHLSGNGSRACVGYYTAQMSEDRRIRRTQESLRRALIALVLEKGFAAVTVGEITSRANVGRSTFYTHYADKLDLLQDAISGLRLLLQEAAQRTPNDPLGFLEPLLVHAHESQPLFRRLTSADCGGFVVDVACDLWAELIQERTELAALEAHAVAGSIHAVLARWLQSECELPATEVARRLRSVLAVSLSPDGVE